MNTVNLAFQVPDYRKMDSGAMPEKETPTKDSYPSMTICDNKDLARSLRPGQEFTATVKFRVSEISIRDRDEDEEDDEPMNYAGSSGTRVELEAQSMVMDGVNMKMGSEEEDGKEAVGKYFNKKSPSFQTK